MNKFFHYKDRGGTLGGEITAGLGIFFLSVCGIFINMQLIAKLLISGEYAASNAQQIYSNGEYYALTWFLSMLIAFAGSLLMGVVARLPLVQVGGLGLSTVLVSMIGIETGLNYYNLLFVCFVSSLVYTVLVAVPGLKTWIFQALPKPVRKALPAAAGLLMAWVAIQLSGIITVQGSRISVYGNGTAIPEVSETVQMAQGVSFGNYSYAVDPYHPLLMITALSAIVTIILYLILKQRAKKPFLFSLLGGTVFFFIVYFLCVCLDTKTMKFSLDSLWGRLWMVGSEDAMQLHISTITKNLPIGRIFSKGMDFTAYKDAGGNVALLFAVGILNFLFLNMYEAEAVLQTTGRDTGVFDADDQRDISLALICNAVTNVAAPIFGAAPMEIGKASCAGTKDGAKSGLASVVASIGFLISAFVWIVPFLFATTFSTKITFNLYGHYGTVMQLMCETGFAVADIVMVILGLSMAAGCLGEINWKKTSEAAPFLAAVAGTFAMSNLACGVALGTVAYVIIKLTSKKEEGEEGNVIARVGVPSLVWAGVSLVLLIVTWM